MSTIRPGEDQSAPASDAVTAGASAGERSGFTAWLAQPASVLLIIAGWALVHLLLRGLLSPVIGTDDMMENVFVQTLEQGYSLRQPPLYEWLLWPLQQLTGPTIWSFLILKYALVLAAAACLLALARKAMPPLHAAFCILSFSAFYQFGWNLHEGVTHTLVLVLASAATALALVHALQRGGLASYLLLGLALGAGLLSKHSYLLFIAALVLGVASDRIWRNRVWLPGIILALCVAALCYAPYVLWLLDQPRTLVSETSNVLMAGETRGHGIGAMTGIVRLGWGLLGFSMPFMVLVPLIFWRELAARFSAQDTPEPGELPETEAAAVARLCGRVVLFAIVLAAAGILITGASYVKERHMHPVLLLLPVWLFAQLGQVPPLRWRHFGLLLAGLALIAFFARVPGLVAPEKAFCGGKCRHMKPYAELLPELGRLGAGEATLIGDDDYTAGNLRVLFPSARVVSPSWRPPTPARASCILVWEAAESRPERAAAEDFARLFPALSPDDLAGEPHFVSVGWPHPWRDSSHRITSFGIARLDPASSYCQ